jgi:ribulose kinase
MQRRIEDDLENLAVCLTEAKLGQHSKAIAKKLGLSEGQVVSASMICAGRVKILGMVSPKNTLWR